MMAFCDLQGHGSAMPDGYLSNKIIRLSKKNHFEAETALLTLVVDMHQISGY
jgi:hypothetical protein